MNNSRFFVLTCSIITARMMYYFPMCQHRNVFNLCLPELRICLYPVQIPANVQGIQGGKPQRSESDWLSHCNARSILHQQSHFRTFVLSRWLHGTRANHYALRTTLNLFPLSFLLFDTPNLRIQLLKISVAVIVLCILLRFIFNSQVVVLSSPLRLQAVLFESKPPINMIKTLTKSFFERKNNNL